jgi:predicted CXXCH cytochrome family protein
MNNRANMTFRFAVLLLSLAALCAGAGRDQDDYAGAEVCATCHRAIYDTQAKTAMANTWHGKMAALPALKFAESKPGGSGNALHYEVRRAGDHLEFSVEGIAKERFTANVNAMIGGKRHGISFLLRVDQIGSISLERPALIEGRYASSRIGTLVLSPGFLKEVPVNYEDALGRVLSPTFEQRCLTCHGEPGTLGAGKQGGVRCESCHGPASAHVNSVTAGNHGQQLVRPRTLDSGNSMDVCAQCHNGLTTATHSDPMPEDVLVSNQVAALRKTECFIQSAEKLTCTSCHNPHEDSATVAQTSVNVCLQCHSLSAPQHAAICPVNRTQGCVGCHMRTVDLDPFHLTDHWIRASPEAGSKAKPVDESLRSQVLPKREFLRLIIVEDAEKMKAVTQRLAKGDSFSTVAHDLSVDGTAPGGGYIGEVNLAEMDSKLATAAAHLPYGGTSEVVETGNRWLMLQRLPRDFRWEADRLFQEAKALNTRGDRAGAIDKNKQALQVYPYFLRALTLMGTMLGQSGNVSRASEVLQFAVQSYPKDPFSQFNLALTLGNQPANQIEAFRRAIELDPDMVAAYQSLGAALYSNGQAAAAIETFHRGLQIDPLSAVLYYDLGLALKEQGDSAGAEKALALAGSLDPEIAARKAH